MKLSSYNCYIRTKCKWKIPKNSQKFPKMHENIIYNFWIWLCHWKKSWKVRFWYSEIAEFPNGIIHLRSLCLVWLPVQGHEQELGNGGIKLKTTLKEILIQKADICTVFGFVEFLKIKKKYWNWKIKKIFCYNCLDFYHVQSFVPVQCSILVFPVLLSRNSVSKRSQILGLWPRTLHNFF